MYKTDNSTQLYLICWTWSRTRIILKTAGVNVYSLIFYKAIDLHLFYTFAKVG